MASAENKSPNSKANEKLECLSRSALLRIVSYVNNEISKSISKNAITIDENGTFKSKILQIYKTAISANVNCDGQPVSLDTAELDTSSEYEPFDTGKENYISHVLMDQLEQQMIATARLRKTGQSQVHSKLKKLIRPELKHLFTVEVKPRPDDDCVMETDSGTTNTLKDIEERLQGTGQQADSMKQMCIEMHQKARDLSKAVSIYHRSENSEFQQALSETPPSTPEVTQQKCLQRTKMDKNISKKLPI